MLRFNMWLSAITGRICQPIFYQVFWTTDMQVTSCVFCQYLPWHFKGILYPTSTCLSTGNNTVFYFFFSTGKLWNRKSSRAQNRVKVFLDPSFPFGIHIKELLIFNMVCMLWASTSNTFNTCSLLNFWIRYILMMFLDASLQN